ncbi:MAG: hypothetical protein HOV80_03460 [Polyangiaceae bacterium]|nr:hypothetical protein [Polyangiaceae bacterium]
MRRMEDFALRPDRPAGTEQPEGLDSLVWSAHLILTDRYLGYLPFEATNHDLRHIRRVLAEFLVEPPEIDLPFLTELMTWAAGQDPTARVAAELAACLLLRTVANDETASLGEQLLAEYWYELRTYRLGVAADWLAKSLGQLEGYDHPRDLRRCFVHNALDFAPHVETLCAAIPVSSALAAEGVAFGRLAEVLTIRPTLAAGLGLRAGETTLELVTRAVQLFREHEERRARRRISAD